MWTSHHLDEIERNCDRAVMLSRGVVVTDSPIHDLRKARASFQTQLIVGPTELTRDQLGKLKEFRLNQVSATEFAYQGEPDDFLYASALPFLVKANAIPVAIRRPEPSLEDIYMELTSEVV